METILAVVRVMGALGLVVFGGIAVFRPKTAAVLVRLNALNANGLTETRVNLGGFLLGMGIVALLMNDTSANTMVGGVYLTAVLSRILGYVLDRPEPNRAFVGAFIFELIVGVVLLLPL